MRRTRAKTTLVPLTREIAAKVSISLDRPHVAKACFVGKRLVGMGGLYWAEGLCWLWLDAVDMKVTKPFIVFRTARDMLERAAALGEKRVFAARDPAPCSERLLALLGFEKLPPHEEFGDVEIWATSLAR